MDLSIIIVSWNTRDLLAQCLESVFKEVSDTSTLATAHCPPTTEVFVVDNASADGSAQMVRERFPQVHLIENHENVGFARANNQAIRISTGRYVLLLNSDTLVLPNALAQMVAFMDAHPEAGIVGANVLNVDGTPQFCYGKFPSLIPETFLALGLNTHFPFSLWFHPQVGVDQAFIETDWVAGAALLVRRATLDQVGLLDESYFMYSEEIDLARRVQCAGWHTCVVRDAPIVHLGQQSSKQMPAVMKAQLFRSKVLYFNKHHGRMVGALLRFIFGATVIVKCWTYRALQRTSLAELWSETWRYFESERK